MEASKLNLAIKSSLIGRLSQYIVQIIVLMLMARFYSPENFGILASLQVFILFFQLLSDMGIGPAIINERSLLKKKRDGIFSFTIILGVVMFFVSYIVIDMIARDYYSFMFDNLEIFITIISLNVFFFSASILPTAAFNKDAKFIYLSFITSVSEVLSFIISLISLVYFDPLVCLSIKVLSYAVFRFSFVYLLSNKTSIGRPKLSKSIGEISSILEFSIYQFLFSLVNYFSRNLDTILISKYFGPVSIGVYDKAYQLMRYPLLLTSFSLTPAIQPILNKHRDDVDFIVLNHNKLSFKICSISLLMSLFIYTNADVIVYLMFGDAWSSVSPILAVFSLIIPFQAVLCTSGAFYQAMNKPKLLFKAGLVSSLINVAFIIYGIYLGNFYYVAVCFSIGYVLNFFTSYYIMFKYCFSRKVTLLYKELVLSVKFVLPSILIYFACYYSLLLLFKDRVILFWLNLILSLVIVFVFRKKYLNMLRG